MFCHYQHYDGASSSGLSPPAASFPAHCLVSGDGKAKIVSDNTWDWTLGTISVAIKIHLPTNREYPSRRTQSQDVFTVLSDLPERHRCSTVLAVENLSRFGGEGYYSWREGTKLGLTDTNKSMTAHNTQALKHGHMITTLGCFFPCQKYPLGWASPIIGTCSGQAFEKFLCKTGRDAARNTELLELFPLNGVLPLHLCVSVAFFKSWRCGPCQCKQGLVLLWLWKKSYDFTGALVWPKQTALFNHSYYCLYWNVLSISSFMDLFMFRFKLSSHKEGLRRVYNPVFI